MSASASPVRVAGGNMLATPAAAWAGARPGGGGARTRRVQAVEASRSTAWLVTAIAAAALLPVASPLSVDGGVDMVPLGLFSALVPPRMPGAAAPSAAEPSAALSSGGGGARVAPLIPVDLRLFGLDLKLQLVECSASLAEAGGLRGQPVWAYTGTVECAPPCAGGHATIAVSRSTVAGTITVVWHLPDGAGEASEEVLTLDTLVSGDGSGGDGGDDDTVDGAASVRALRLLRADLARPLDGAAPHTDADAAAARPEPVELDLRWLAAGDTRPLLGGTAGPAAGAPNGSAPGLGYAGPVVENLAESSGGYTRGPQPTARHTRCSLFFDVGPSYFARWAGSGSAQVKRERIATKVMAVALEVDSIFRAELGLGVTVAGWQVFSEAAHAGISGSSGAGLLKSYEEWLGAGATSFRGPPGNRRDPGSPHSQQVCSNVLLVHSGMLGGTAGTANRARVPMHYVGGLCEQYMHLDGASRRYRALNTAVINTRISRDLNFWELVTTVAHELGHAFGAPHTCDPSSQNCNTLTNMCNPAGSDGGGYIMFPKLRTGANSKRFSPCSKQTIATVVSAKGSCLTVPPGSATPPPTPRPTTRVPTPTPVPDPPTPQPTSALPPTGTSLPPSSPTALPTSATATSLPPPQAGDACAKHKQCPSQWFCDGSICSPCEYCAASPKGSCLAGGKCDDVVQRPYYPTSAPTPQSSPPQPVPAPALPSPLPPQQSGSSCTKHRHCPSQSFCDGGFCGPCEYCAASPNGPCPAGGKCDGAVQHPYPTPAAATAAPTAAPTATPIAAPTGTPTAAPSLHPPTQRPSTGPWASAGAPGTVGSGTGHPATIVRHFVRQYEDSSGLRFANAFHRTAFVFDLTRLPDMDLNGSLGHCFGVCDRSVRCVGVFAYETASAGLFKCRGLSGLGNGGDGVRTSVANHVSYWRVPAGQLGADNDAPSLLQLAARTSAAAHYHMCGHAGCTRRRGRRVSAADVRR